MTQMRPITTSEHHRVMTCVWNGELLCPGPISLVIFETPAAANPSNVPLLAAAASATQQVVFDLNCLKQFFELHCDRELITYDAANLHWTAAELLQSVGADAMRMLWAFSRESRLVDLRLLDELVDMATGEARRPYQDFAEFASDRSNLAVTSIELVSQELLRQSQRGGLDSLDQQLLTDIGSIVDAQLRIYEVLMGHVQQIAAQAQPEPPQASQYGPLGLGLEVQGAIALSRQNGLLAIDPDAIDAAIAHQRERFWRHADLLAANQESRESFKAPRRDAEAPKLNVKNEQLQRLLGRISETIREAAGLRPARPATVNKERNRDELSTVPARWARLCRSHPILFSWAECVAASRCIRLLSKIKAERKTLAVIPRCLPRMHSIARVGVNRQTSLEDFVGSGLFQPPPNQVFIIAKFDEIEVAALAAICECQFGTSRIADLLREGKNPINVAAEACRQRLPNFKMGGAQSDREHFWSRAVSALIEATALKLAPESACAILTNRHEVNLSPAAACQLNSQLSDFFPELRRYCADDTIERVAAHLRVKPERVQRELGESATGVHLRRILVQRSPSQTQLAQELSAQSPLMSSFFGFGQPCPFESVLMRQFTTPTGRVRASAHYCDEFAEYLDLADHALKAASYAVAAEGYIVAGCVDHEIAVVAPQSECADRIVNAIESAARDAATRVLQGIPAYCRVTVRSHW